MNGEVKSKFEKTSADEKISYDDIVATLFCVLEGVTDTIKRGLNEDDTLFLALRLEELFGKCYYKLFPEYAPEEGREFDLCDAAIIKAQDDIIKEAEKEGKTIQQVLLEYNDRAREYVNARKMS